MKYNNEIVGNQYELREIIILNWIEHFTSDEEERKDMRMNLQCYLQQEIWEELEGMQLVDTRETDYKKRLAIIFDNIDKLSDLIQSRDFDSSEANTLITNILVCTDTDEKRVEREWRVKWVLKKMHCCTSYKTKTSS